MTDDQAESPISFLEYYTFVIPQVIGELEQQIYTSVHEDRSRLREEFWKPHATTSPHSADEGWSIARDYLSRLEKEIAGLVSTHSAYYWIHLYRRLGVRLPQELYDRKTDPNTVGLVRAITEAAFVKFGSLERVGDIELTSRTTVDAVMRGLFKLNMMRILKGDESKLKELWDGLSEQWVLLDYTPTDQLNLFRIEGFAYEYWRATAVMRALGKGAALVVEQDGFYYDHRSPELSTLIDSYDQRIAAHPFSSTAVGISFYSADASDDRHSALIGLAYNIHQRPFREVYPPATEFPADIISNFEIGLINIRSYVEEHALLSKPFQSKHDLPYEDLCVFIAAIGNILFALATQETDHHRPIWGLCQRAYRAFNWSPEKTCNNAISWAQALNERGFPYGRGLDKTAARCKEFLTLSKDKQGLVSLWTHGPRFLFVPYGDHQVIDLEGVDAILVNLFFGVRHQQTEKGYLFEDYFRKSIENEGFTLLPNRVLVRDDGTERETDAAVRIGDTLVLMDCRTVERPLDFEIGKPITIRTRCDLLEQKIESVVTIADFAMGARKGRNYDFSWAKNIVSLAVTPFMEWIWSIDQRYWMDRSENFPRILHSHEALELLRRLSKGIREK